MNTPPPVSINVQINGEMTIKALNAFAALGLNYANNQQANPAAWHYLLSHEAYIRSLTEVCKSALKIDPPAASLDVLKQLAVQQPTLHILQLRATICLSAVNSLARLMTEWTMDAAKRLNQAPQKVTESAPVKLH